MFVTISRWYFIVLICNSLILNGVDHLFMYLLAICSSSLEKCLFSPFTLFFFIASLTFLELSCRSCFIFFRLTCQLLHFQLLSGTVFSCYYFLSFWMLSFHLAYSFLRCANVFRFNKVPFVLFLLIFPLFWEVGHRRSRWDLHQRVFCLCFPVGVL